MKKQLLIAVMALLGVSGASASTTRTTTWDFKSTISTIGDAGTTAKKFTRASANGSRAEYSSMTSPTGTISCYQYATLDKDGFQIWMTGNPGLSSESKGLYLSSANYLVIQNMKEGDKITITWSPVSDNANNTLNEYNGTEAYMLQDASGNKIEWKSAVTSSTTYTYINSSTTALILRPYSESTKTTRYLYIENITIERQVPLFDFTGTTTSTQITPTYVESNYEKKTMYIASGADKGRYSSTTLSNVTQNWKYKEVTLDSRTITFGTLNTTKSTATPTDVVAADGGYDLISSSYFYLKGLKNGDKIKFSFENNSKFLDYTGIHGPVMMNGNDSVAWKGVVSSDVEYTVYNSDFVILKNGAAGNRQLYSIDIVPAETEIKSATIEVNKYGLGTFYSPLTLKIDAAAKAKIQLYTATINGNEVTLNSIANRGALPGMTPVLVRSLVDNEGDKSVSVTVSTQNGTYNMDKSESDFVGTLSDITLDQTSEGNTNYVLNVDAATESIVGFYLANNTSVSAGKCYLPVPTPASGAKTSYVFTFNDDETTAINNVDATANVSKVAEGKFFQNGKLVIVRNGKQYNAAGAQVK